MCQHHVAIIQEKDRNIQFIQNFQLGLASLEAAAKDPPTIKSRAFQRIMQTIKEEFPGFRFDLQGVVNEEKSIINTFIAEELDKSDE